MAAPNLLFIYTDEQAFNTLAAYGNSQIEMPNLNRLAGESYVFDRAYVTQPVCTPARASLLTGQYPHTTGCTELNIPLRPDSRCLPEMIAHGDHVAAHFGKWHLGDELFPQHGFGKWSSIEDGYECGYSEGRDRQLKSNYHQFLVENGFTPENGENFKRGECARLPEAYGKPAFLAGEASRFIRENKSRPFALYVNFLEPHMPFYGPRDDQYDPSTIPLPANFHDVPGSDRPLKTRLLQEAFARWSHSGLPLQSEDDWRQMIANYWGLCSLIDTHTGAILDTLDACGLRDNTIVVFTSDHGDMMGSHRLIAKCVMFEESVRVPLLIRLPGQRTSKRITGPVSQIDLVPSLLDLMEQPLPDHLQGSSLRPVMESDHQIASENVFIQWNGPNSGLAIALNENRYPEWMTAIASPDRILAAGSDPVRTIIRPDGWKMNCSPLGEHELYNLERDPHEMQNLYEEKKGDELVRELVDQIRNWQDRMGDTVELPRVV
jgi:arylsulfatase A-like enzyme